MFDDTRDFLQIHFYFPPRDDTPFWRANKELALSPEVTEKINLYKAGIPVNPPAVGQDAYYANFEAEFRNFWTNGSYCCILTGLGIMPGRYLSGLDYKPGSIAAADGMLAAVQERQDRLLRELPTTHEYLQRLHSDQPRRAGQAVTLAPVTA